MATIVYILWRVLRLRSAEEKPSLRVLYRNPTVAGRLTWKLSGFLSLQTQLYIIFCPSIRKIAIFQYRCCWCFLQFTKWCCLQIWWGQNCSVFGWQGRVCRDTSGQPTISRFYYHVLVESIEYSLHLQWLDEAEKVYTLDTQVVWEVGIPVEE